MNNNLNSWLDKNIIFETLTGSRLYGTALPESDYDFRGIVVPPIRVMIDPFQHFEQQTETKVNDRVVYSISQFFNLAVKANPNILELLFASKEAILKLTDKGKLLIKNREHFLSKNIGTTFVGYAYSQMHKMKLHREWFINPPRHKPTRKEYGLTDVPIISGEGLNAVTNIKRELFAPQFSDEIQRELDYREAKKRWDKYQEWLNGRNPIRRELEAKYLYDTKSAMHLFRLIYEGNELLMTGNINFPLRYAKELLEIRNGKYSYDEVLNLSEELITDLEHNIDASPIQSRPNHKKLLEVYYEILEVK